MSRRNRRGRHPDIKLTSQAGAVTLTPYPTIGNPMPGKGAPILGPMPSYSEKRPTPQEYGAPGIPVMTGVIVGEEHNPDLQWREAIRLYERMLRSEPMVRQSLLICELPLRSAIWKIAPASPHPDHIEQASFIESSLFHDLEGQDWDSLLREIQLARAYGFTIFEKNFTATENGMTRWRTFGPRLPRTIYRWWESGNNTLAGIQQWTWVPATQRWEYINIPAGKLLRFTYRQEANNYEGVSILRTAYQPFFYKTAFLKLMAVGLEREHVGIPVVTLPDGYSDADLARAQQIGKNMRSNEQAYVTLPPGWTLEWLKARTSAPRGGSILDSIRYMDLQMQNNVLASFLSLGQTGTGSYAASTDQTELFLRNCQADATWIAGVFNADAFPELIRFNYPDPGMYPRLIAQNIQAYNPEMAGKAIAALVMAGAVRPSVELEDYLYNLFGIPRPPANQVESTDPADNIYGHSRLKPDATGLTPLPLTPQEEIAMAYRQTRDLQRIGVIQPGATGADSGGNRAIVGEDARDRATDTAATRSARAEMHASGHSGGVPSPASALTEPPINDVYLTERFQRLRGHQRDAYIRLAEEAGRPQIRLTSEPIPSVTLERQRRRQEMASEMMTELRRNFADLENQLTGALADNQRLTEELDDAEAGNDSDT